MKIQWIGLSQQSFDLSQQIDYAGIANASRLRERTRSSKTCISGSTRSFPFFAVLASGYPAAPAPAYAARTVVSELTRRFHFDARSFLFDSITHHAWLKMQYQELATRFEEVALESPQLAGCCASCACLVAENNGLCCARWGDTHLCLFRNGKCISVSEGQLPQPVFAEAVSDAPFLSDTRSVARFEPVAEQKTLMDFNILQLELCSGDIIGLFTESSFRPSDAEMLEGRFSKVRSGMTLRNEARMHRDVCRTRGGSGSLGSVLLRVA